VHRLGIDEPRLVRFARALSASGVAVLASEVRALVDYRIEDGAPEDIGVAAHALHERTGARVGVMGMSFAGGLALLAASDPRYRDDVAFVVAVGAHDDLGRVARFFATNEIARPDGTTLRLAAHPYGPLVLVYDHARDFFPEADLAGATDALRLWLWEEKDAARARLASVSPRTASALGALFDDDLTAITPKLVEEIRSHEAAMRAVSPREHMAGLRVPVYLLHGSGDTVIPPTETLWLADDVPSPLVRDVLVSPALVHVELEGAPGWRDKWALVHFMADVLGAARSARR
jgi:pimeloyl-ACP methyl ester carboxylesterase